MGACHVFARLHILRRGTVNYCITCNNPLFKLTFFMLGIKCDVNIYVKLNSHRATTSCTVRRWKSLVWKFYLLFFMWFKIQDIVVLYFLHELIGCHISKDLSGWACSYKVKKCWIAAGFRWTWSPVAVTVFWRTRDLCRFKVVHLGDQAYECRFTIRAFSLNLFEPIVLRSLPSTVERTVVNFMLRCLSRLFYHPWCQIRLSLHKS